VAFPHPNPPPQGGRESGRLASLTTLDWLKNTGARPIASALVYNQNMLFRIAIACLIIAALAAAAFALAREPGPGQALSLSLIFGAVFGFVLQRSRFCFFCMFRDWFDEGDPRGLLGLLVALAVGIAGYTLVFGAWLPDPASGRLPPDAFIGPISGVLVLAGLAFGAGMAISGSCVSAHLYRLGEGSPTAPFALAGTLIGFIAGFATWNPLYLSTVSAAPMLWLPAWRGYAGAMAASLAALGILAWVIARGWKTVRQEPAASPWQAVFINRWPAWAGGLAVGALGMAAYLRVQPLGVTAEIAARARAAGDTLGLLPTRLEGLDTLRGCIAVAQDVLLSPNGCFVGAMILAAFAAALVAGQFRPVWPSADQVVRGLLGGVLLGWGAMTGLGCTVGTLMSGIMAGAVSGWVFGASVFAAIAVTLWLGRRARLLPAP